jgi:NADH:ubiquinone reductase (H+-translocating)
MVNVTEQRSRHRVVIVGGGFGGLYAAKTLSRAKHVDVTLIDKRNFHLFQPLLYQVATGTLSPADISSPLRSVLSACKNVRVLMAEVVDIDPTAQQIILADEALPYDSLIVATGVSHHYFGNEQWKETAPGLKTVEDALEMRRRIFSAFEAAEKETDPDRRQALLTFVVVGGGPTGVELAGAIAELAFNILKEDFRTINTADAQILLLEGLDRILPPYAPELSAQAAASLTHLGVKVLTKARVTHIEAGEVTLMRHDQTEVIPARTILWAAGVKASALGEVLAQRTGASRDRVGRVIVEADLSIANHPNIFVIGDLAHFAHQDDQPLPGVAPVAMQAGKYVGQLIQKRLQDQTLPAFSYTDKGSLAIIGQNAAVVDLGFVRITGFLAWLIWLFAHLYYLIEFDNKLVVMIQWAWNYFTRSRGARIITGEEVFGSPPDGVDPSREARSVVEAKTPVEV